MVLYRLQLGFMGTNTYIYGSDEKKVAIIDPGFDADTIIAFIKDKHYEPVAIILTHGHPDHVGMVKVLQKYYAEKNLPIVCSKHMDPEYTGTKNISHVVDGDRVSIDGMELEVLDAPGHSPDSILLVNHPDKLIFVGDVIFQGGVGRSDMAGGNSALLMRSIHDKIMHNPRLQGNYRLLTGHGMPTDVETERKYNPFRSMWE